MKQPLIIDLKGNSLDDGPGIRSVVFIKGCPLRCDWCQNPESQKAGPELIYFKEKCIGCGSCIEVCPEKAISPDNTYFVDRGLCTGCFKCTDVCPSRALRPVGKEMTVDEIVQEIIPYKSFFETSGGGVTLSGGEPTLFMEFSSELLRRLKGEGIHTLLETCGWFEMERFEELMLPWLDMIYMDIKIIDPDEHSRRCGVRNQMILKNFRHLSGLAAAGQVDLLPRTPLIPGVTDTGDRIRDLIGFYIEYGISKASLLGYNPIWIDKCGQLGLDSMPGPESEMRKFYDAEQMETVKSIFYGKGIRIIG